MAENTKKIFVVDASFVLAFLLKEQSSISQVFQKHVGQENKLISADLLSYEVGNGLQSAVLKKRLERKKAGKLYENFLNLKISESRPEILEVLRACFEKNLTFYDAAYLALAQNKKLPLLTIDKQLKRLTKN